MKPLPLSLVRHYENLGPDELVRVYSYQGEEAMDCYKAKGYLTGDSLHIESDDHDFPKPYAWMREQMALRIPDFSGDYPVWAWLKRPSAKPKDRKYRGTKERYRFTALVPRSRILLSDYELWHSPLNQFPITLTEASFDAEEGEDNPQATWERIFEFPDSLPPDQRDWLGDCSRPRVQVCIDRIYVDEVVGIRVMP